MKFIRLQALTVLLSVVLSGCGISSVSNSQKSLPPLLVEENNPVDPTEGASKILFKEMYKNGTAKTAKEMMEWQENEMHSGELPINGGISPGFYVRNNGGYLKGVRLTIDGTALDQGMLVKPEIIINTDSLYSSSKSFALLTKESYREALKTAQYVGAPTTESLNGMMLWVVNAPDIEVNANGKIHIAMNCSVMKAGKAGFTFSIYSLNDTKQALLRHSDFVNVDGR